MKLPSLLHKGDKICFQDENKLKRILPLINDFVPARTNGRDAEHRERYCLKRYLDACSQKNLLSFPFCIEKGESPDFLMEKADGSKIGLEHTDATTETFQQESTELERQQVSCLSSCSTHDEAKKRFQEKFVHIGGRLDGEEGNAREQEWAGIILDAIKKKVTLINKGHYTPCTHYELLIYSNTHIDSNAYLLGFSREKAISIIKKMIGNISVRPFDKISVIFDRQVILDIENQAIILVHS